MPWPQPRAGCSGRGTGCEMLLKIVSLFLIAMMVLGMFGKLRFPRPRLMAKKCKKCGTPMVGAGPCPCDKRV